MNKKMKISGVYKVANNVTGDFYIGSSKDIKQRWARHKCPSAWRYNPGVKLYQAFIKYGLDNFIFEVIEETDNLKEREQYWIEQLKPSYNSFWAYGHNEERWKETSKRWHKEWYKAHLDEHSAKKKAYYEAHIEEVLAKKKAYYEAHRDGLLIKNKSYYNRLCLYEGETLTLNALRARFIRQGIPHAALEAKKYLIEKEETNETIE